MIREFVDSGFVHSSMTNLQSRLSDHRDSFGLLPAITIATIQDYQEELAELWFIYENTTSDIGENLSLIENLAEKSASSTPKTKTFLIGKKEIPFAKIIKSLSDAYINITICVSRIAKDLNVDIHFDASKYPIK